MKALLVGLVLGLGAIGCSQDKKAQAVEPAADQPSISAPTKADSAEKPGAAAPAKAEPAAAIQGEAQGAAEIAVGKPAPDFELKDENGKPFKLSDQKGKIVILEWTAPACPFVKRHYKTKTMQGTLDKLRSEKVVWAAIDSSHYVKPEKSAAWKKEEMFTYPVLQDPSGEVGKVYGAKTTPHMYVIDETGVLRYDGAIDDDPRGDVEAPKNYVLAAASALLAGKEVENKQTKPYGCSVKYK